MATSTMERATTSPTQEILRHVVLINPTLGWWKGHYKIGRADNVSISVDNVEVDSTKVTTPQTKLMDCCDELKTWQKRFQKIDSRRSSLIERLSEPFALHGVRIVPRGKLREFMDSLIGPVDEYKVPTLAYDADGNYPLDVQSIAYDLKVAGDEFALAWPDLYRLMARHTPESIWARVKGKLSQYHEPRELRRRFYVRALPITIGGTSEQVGLEEIEAYSDQIRESVATQVEEAISQMISGPREALAEALGNLHDLIKDEGRVTQKSFKPVIAAIEKIRSFKFIANDELLASISAMERRLDAADPKTLNPVTAASNGLFTAIEALQAEVADADKRASDAARFGRGRNLDL